MPTNNPLPHTACGVCGHVLNRYTGPFGESWLHVLDTDNDHPPVPVPVASAQTKLMCDFCLTEGARWILPVEDYEVGDGGQNVGDWLACDACADMLRRDDWNALITRAMHTMRERHAGAAPSRRTFETMYGQLRQHVVGEVRLATVRR